MVPLGSCGKVLEAKVNDRVMSPLSPDLENRGSEIAESYYARRSLTGKEILESAELLYQLWTRDRRNVKMHAIAEGFRRQAYIIAMAQQRWGAAPETRRSRDDD